MIPQLAILCVAGIAVLILVWIVITCGRSASSLEETNREWSDGSE